eukprot:m.91934 g.91934  ORF g.91934 m.91934 type:complete len:87 (+) comp26511_c1_seq1:37-297(+)
MKMKMVSVGLFGDGGEYEDGDGVCGGGWWWCVWGGVIWRRVVQWCTSNQDRIDLPLISMLLCTEYNWSTRTLNKGWWHWPPHPTMD